MKFYYEVNDETGEVDNTKDLVNVLSLLKGDEPWPIFYLIEGSKGGHVLDLNDLIEKVKSYQKALKKELEVVVSDHPIKTGPNDGRRKGQEKRWALIKQFQKSHVKLTKMDAGSLLTKKATELRRKNPGMSQLEAMAAVVKADKETRAAALDE